LIPVGAFIAGFGIDYISPRMVTIKFAGVLVVITMIALIIYPSLDDIQKKE
jgi:hypothetical protein